MDSFRTQDLASMPISALTIAVCGGVYVYQRVKSADLSKVWFSYQQIVGKREFWRMVTSVYTHGGIIHLLMNVFTIFQQGMSFEAVIGWIQFAKAIYFLVILSGLVTLIVSAILHQANFTAYANTPAVGYSGVLFGIFALESLQAPFATVKLLYFIPVPFLVVPFIYLVVMQFLVPNVSFIGHSAGIVAGYLTYFFEIQKWFGFAFFIVAFILTGALCLYSYLRTRERNGSHWELPSHSSGASSGGKARIVNG